VPDYGQLCQHRSLHGLGERGLAYSPLVYTQHVAAQADECSALLNKGPYLRLWCLRRAIKTDWPELWFPWDEIEACPQCGVLEALQPGKEQWIRVGDTYVLELPLGLESRTTYRVSAALAGHEGASGSAWISSGGAVVASSETFGGELSIMSGTFVADASGTLTLEAEGELSIGHIAVVPADGRNTFDAFTDRLGIGLYDAEQNETRPARFAGTEAGGFEALVEPSERLVLSREALPEAEALFVAGGLTHGGGQVRIGIVTADGDEVATSEFLEEGDFAVELETAGHTAAALFIEVEEAEGSVGLDWLQVTPG
jgi:hypothetical protein